MFQTLLIFTLIVSGCSGNKSGFKDRDAQKSKKLVHEEDGVEDLSSLKPKESDLVNLFQLTKVEDFKDEPYFTRLMKQEYKFIILDMLGASQLESFTKLLKKVPENNYTGSYKNRAIIAVYPGVEAYHLEFSQLFAEKYLDSDQYKKLCKEGDCFETIVESLVPRVWRRSLSSQDIEDLQELYQSETGRNAMKLLLTRIFLSPSFHYKRHTSDSKGADRAFEIGSLISFALNGSIPDDLLLTDIKNQKILHPNVVREHAKRFLQKNPNRFSQLFISQWMGFSTVIDTIGDETYKDVPLDSVLSEPSFIFAFILQEKGDLADLFNLKFNAVNGPLAKLYQLPIVDDWKKANATNTIFGTGAMSYKFSDHEKDTPRPILRGFYVVNNLLCGSVQEATPEQLELATQVVKEGQELMEQKGEKWSPPQEMEYYRSKGSCKACHESFDHHGFALEEIGVLGKARQTYENGDDVKAEGEAEGIKYSSSADFVSKFSKLDKLKACFIGQAYNYLSGHSYKRTFGVIANHEKFSSIRSLNLPSLIEELMVYTATGGQYEK